MDFGYNISFKALDRGIVEVIGPFGIVRTIGNLTRIITNLQSGYIYHYAFIMFTGITLFISLISLSGYISSILDVTLYFIFMLALIIYSLV